MNTCDILKELRLHHHLTQDQMAERLLVTRQAVSRWETGETVPGTDTLKMISTAFGVSINTLLGSPRRLVCQCCGMPMEEDDVISREPDGSFQEEYCKWCYTGGSFQYDSMEQLMDFLVTHTSSEAFPAEQARVYYAQLLPQLRHWKQP